MLQDIYFGQTVSSTVKAPKLGYEIRREKIIEQSNCVRCYRCRKQILKLHGYRHNRNCVNGKYLYMCKECKDLYKGKKLFTKTPI